MTAKYCTYCDWQPTVQDIMDAMGEVNQNYLSDLAREDYWGYGDSLCNALVVVHERACLYATRGTKC